MVAVKINELKNIAFAALLFLSLAGLLAGATHPARAEPNPPSLTCVSLDGGWQVSDADKNDWIAATVPGCIHTDLLKGGIIPDPFYRDNEPAVKWVGETDWNTNAPFKFPANCSSATACCCAAPALWAWLSLKDSDASYSDNFIHIAPGSPKTITVKPAQTMTLQEFEKALQIRSLYDTYQTL
jgi:beta-galactosidase/beta-glucuronidase